MKKYTFYVTLVTYGDTLEDAWVDAVEAFIENPGEGDDEPYTVEDCEV